MSTAEFHTRLQELHVERALAAIEGLDSNECYMVDLDDEIQAVRDAYAGMAVTEIALLRADLSGPQVG